jgi:RNA polymerase sigma-70 factor (ECF subfamily)
VVASSQTAVHRQQGPARGPSDELFRKLVSPHLAQLGALALRWCKQPSEADDLLQSTLERAYLALDRLDGHTCIRPWLIAIMRNLFRDDCRRRARRKTLDDSWLVSMAAPAEEEVALWRSVDGEQLMSALERVDQGLKRAFLLRWQELRSYQEISAQLDIPINTVGTRLLRARRAIRARVMADLRSAGSPALASD